MDKFIKIEAICAPLDVVNVDTDMIIPKQFLKTIKRTGLGVSLFHEMRYDNDGNEIKDFVLNNAPYNKAGILVSGSNFGCGSSREHAPWALSDFGIKCIIAPSYADIFYNNCFKNGILPIILPDDEVSEIMELAKNDENPVLEVDLETQTISIHGKNIFYKFDIDLFRKKCLMEGLDDIGLTLQKLDKINSFEESYKKNCSWLFDC